MLTETPPQDYRAVGRGILPAGGFVAAEEREEGEEGTGKREEVRSGCQSPMGAVWMAG